MKFGTRVRLKPSNDRGEFELDRARSKYNIAKNLFALGHETHNNLCLQYYYCDFICENLSYGGKNILGPDQMPRVVRGV